MGFCKVALTFESVDEILRCDHSNKSYWAVLSCGTVYYAVQGGSNFWVCGWNPMMWPFKWKLSAGTFTWYYLFLKILENEIWKFGRNLRLATFGSERVNPIQVQTLALNWTKRLKIRHDQTIKLTCITRKHININLLTELLNFW